MIHKILENEMGKTISVTLPEPLVDDLQTSADKVGVSRSRFIGNLLLKWQDSLTLKPVAENSNDCLQKNKQGDCRKYNAPCLVTTKEQAVTCPDYIGKEDNI